MQTSCKQSSTVLIIGAGAGCCRSLTSKNVRRTLEQDLKLAPKQLDAQKKLIDQLIDSVGGLLLPRVNLTVNVAERDGHCCPCRRCC